jgi:hypothetical protein
VGDVTKLTRRCGTDGRRTFAARQLKNFPRCIYSLSLRERVGVREHATALTPTLSRREREGTRGSKRERMRTVKIPFGNFQ